MNGKDKADSEGYEFGIRHTFEQQIFHYDSLMDARGGNGNGGGKPGNNDSGTTPTLTDTYLSGDDEVADESEYNIRIDFYGEWSSELKDDFINSADFLSTLITNDIAPDGYDDVVIQATLGDIDGSGGILGQAGPTHIWTANSLSSQAIMEFDVADANDYEQLGLWDDIVLHEMIHSIGFGTLWEHLGLVETIVVDDNGTKRPNDDTTALVFTGENAIANEPFGNPYPLVETDGGSGTAGGHWDEDTYDNELMTGYINYDNYLSDMTYGALDDMGYDINYTANPDDFWLV